MNRHHFRSDLSGEGEDIVPAKSFYTPIELADILGVSVRTIQAWTKNGKIKAEEPNRVPLTNLLQYKEVKAMNESTWENEAKLKPLSRYSSIELFAGGGGLSLGLEQAGIHGVLHSDRDSDSCSTLKKNRPHWTVKEGDIRTLNFTQFYDHVDVLAGGFP